MVGGWGGILDIAYFVVYVSVCNEYLIHMSLNLYKRMILREKWFSVRIRPTLKENTHWFSIRTRPPIKGKYPSQSALCIIIQDTSVRIIGLSEFMVQWRGRLCAAKSLPMGSRIKNYELLFTGGVQRCMESVGDNNTLGSITCDWPVLKHVTTGTEAWRVIG